MKIDELIQLIEAVNKNKIDKFEYKNEAGEKVSIRKRDGVSIVNAPQVMNVPSGFATPMMSVAGAVTQEPAAIPMDMKSDKVIVSPLVGTFYSSPSPGADAFVKVGDSVKVGQVVGIIEAMKLMNEVESEVDGVIEEILISDEDVVEFGQPLFRVR